MFNFITKHLLLLLLLILNFSVFIPNAIAEDFTEDSYSYRSGKQDSSDKNWKGI